MLIQGESYDAVDAITGLRMILDHLATCGNPDRFFARLSEKTTTKTRSYIARSPEELFRGDYQFKDSDYEMLTEGWYLNKKIRNVEKEKIVNAACWAAGVREGVDIALKMV